MYQETQATVAKLSLKYGMLKSLKRSKSILRKTIERI